jgi:hypothetical protein
MNDSECVFFYIAYPQMLGSRISAQHSIGIQVWKIFIVIQVQAKNKTLTNCAMCTRTESHLFAFIGDFKKYVSRKKIYAL